MLQKTLLRILWDRYARPITITNIVQLNNRGLIEFELDGFEGKKYLSYYYNPVEEWVRIENHTDWSPIETPVC
jgi:hypothetical protein